MKYLLLLASVILLHCSKDEGGRDFAYLLTPDGFLNPVELKDDPDPNPKKYVLSWKNPTNQSKLVENRIYLDTTNWNTILKDPKEAKGQVLHIPAPKDEDGNVIYKDNQTIIFSLGKVTEGVLEKTSNYNNTGFPYYVFDTTGIGELIDSLDYKINFALVSVHDGDIGQPRFSHIVVDDRFAPYTLRQNITVKATEFSLSWTRPRDQTSFFNSDPDLDTGLIEGYHIILKSLRQLDNENYQALDIKSILYVFHDDSASSEDTSWSMSPYPDTTGRVGVHVIDANDSLGKVDIFLEDKGRFGKETVSFTATIFGLEPEQKYEYQIYAQDSNNNIGTKGAEISTFTTTDVSKPKAIENFNVIEKNQNKLVLQWEPTRDTRSGDENPDQNIQSYTLKKISRTDSLIAGSGDTTTLLIHIGSDLDTVRDFKQAKVSFPLGDSSRYTASFFFLPPGKWYTFEVWAHDSTGHLSSKTQLIAGTEGTSETIACPEGMIPIPKNSEPFCIEPYEHRDSLGKFVTQVTLDEAIEACAELSQNTSGVEYYLCSESEWRRACEGSNLKNPHIYGIQSIDTSLAEISASTSILQTSCNQGGDDEAMAFDLSLRNEICSTNEGVFDLAGNLSEWVTVDSANKNVHFKGGNYLKPLISRAELQAKAQCARPSFAPKLPRPNYNCLSNVPNFTIEYRAPLVASGKQLICGDLTDHPEGVKSIKVIDSIKVDGEWIRKDSARLLVNYIDGNSEKINLITLGSPDSLAPSAVSLTQKQLAEFIYIPADEYDYSRFFLSNGHLDTTEFQLAAQQRPFKYIRDTLEIHTFNSSESIPSDVVKDSSELLRVDSLLEFKSLVLALLDSTLKVDSLNFQIADSLTQVWKDTLNNVFKDSLLAMRNDSLLMIINDSLLSKLIEQDSLLRDVESPDSMLILRNDTLLYTLHGLVFDSLNNPSIELLDNLVHFDSANSTHLIILMHDSLINESFLLTQKITSDLERQEALKEQLDQLEKLKEKLVVLLETEHDMGNFEFSTEPLFFNKQPTQNNLITRDINKNWKAIPVHAFYGHISLGTSLPGQDPLPHFKPAKRYYNFQAIGFRCCSNPLP